MGLLRGIARTAVVAGTATHVSNNVSRRQARRWTEKDAAAATDQQEASLPPTPDVQQSNDDALYEQLRKLAELKDQGILTQEEFDAKKKQLLGI